MTPDNQVDRLGSILKNARLKLLWLAAPAALGTGVAVWATGGGTWSLGPMTFAARSTTRLFLAGSVATALLLTVSTRTTTPGQKARVAGRTLIGVGFLTLLWSIAGIVFDSVDRACGGLDSYAYVSTAHLLRSGRLSQTEPVGRLLPFETGLEAAAPPGYQPSQTRDAIVPTFPIGFPLVMAAFIALLGPGGAFYVPFVLGAGVTALTYLLARQWMTPVGAALAAVLIASNPVFVNEAIQPMSDVPATFWTLGAVYAISRRRPLALTAGLAAGMAVLTRPPLFLAAIVVGGMAGRRGGRLLRSYLAGFLPLFLLLAVVQWHLYGSPIVSGHGSADRLFTLGVAGLNASHHLKWLMVVHTPLLFAALAAGLRWGERRFTLQALLVFAVVATPYLFYAVVFDDWEMLRFLLPGLVFLLIAAADGVRCAVERLRLGTAADALTLVLAVGIALGSYAFAAQHRVFDVKYDEAKYPLIGWWFQTNAAADAIVMASLHSGSIRFYSNRATVRFEAIPSAKLKDTVLAIRRLGYVCYLVLDGPWETKRFQGHFADTDLQGITMYPEGRIRDIDIFRLEAQATP